MVGIAPRLHQFIRQSGYFRRQITDRGRPMIVATLCACSASVLQWYRPRCGYVVMPARIGVHV